MVSFPNGKINLGLHVLSRREDGFHDLETIFYPVGVHDMVEVIAAEKNALPVSFSASGLEVKGDASGNLCVRACQLLKTDFPHMPPVCLHLHKLIPMGAGLGGGSADGVAVLQLLNELFALNLSAESLLKYALQLGSDCPFFIRNSPCLALGRGEILQPVEIDLSRYRLVIVHPHIHISTAEAFGSIRPRSRAKPLTEVIHQPILTWKTDLRNDFQQFACERHPAIADIIASLYAKSAAYASLTGSGSAVYALFDSPVLPELPFPPSWLVHIS